MELCKHLRWKSYYAKDWRTREELVAIFVKNEVPYDCLRTTRPWGPDGSPAVPECCGSHRDCFEDSPLLPGLPVT